MEELVLLKSFTNFAEAKLAEGLLSANGIKAMVRASNPGSGAFGGEVGIIVPHEILVLEKDLNVAREIIGE